MNVYDTFGGIDFWTTDGVGGGLNSVNYCAIIMLTMLMGLLAYRPIYTVMMFSVMVCPAIVGLLYIIFCFFSFLCAVILDQ